MCSTLSPIWWAAGILSIAITFTVLFIHLTKDNVHHSHCSACVQQVNDNNPLYYLVANKKLEDVFGQPFKAAICQSSFSDIEHIDLSIVLNIAKRRQNSEKETWMIYSLFAYLKNSYAKYGFDHIYVDSEATKIFIE